MSAMCALAFFAFLRIGELTASRGNTTNIINLSQLDRLVDAQGRIQALQLTLHNYKHKNSGPPFVIFIYPERSCCPVQLILNFLAVWGSVSGPLFCWPEGSSITRSYLVEWLNAALTFCNLNTKLYKVQFLHWHCQLGLQTPKFAGLLGRWKSSAFLCYIRTPSLGTTFDTSTWRHKQALCFRHSFCQQPSGGAGLLRSNPWPFSSGPHLC